MASKTNVLLIGGGGREHALALKLKASPLLGELWVTHPQNPGLAELGRAVDVPVNIKEIYRLEQFCDKHAIGLVVIGPEEPLAEGYADKLAAPGRLVFGPTREAARLEWDKAWAKQFMRQAAIPTAEGRIFSDPEAARAYIETREEPPVIKAAGLAKGKGVIVPSTLDEAMKAVDQIMKARVFGEAGDKIVVEERLAGPEVSVLAIIDGRNILMLPPCQDHKRLLDEDRGPNTGGMGAFCPSALVEGDLMERIEREVFVPAIDALRRDGVEFRGVLYAGLMLTHAGPKVLEFNTRFGDPECQPLMALLESDLLELMLAACQGRLDEIEVKWSPGAACCVVMASEGYPDKPKAGAVISGVESIRDQQNTRLIYSGATKDRAGRLVTSGGRVLSVVATGETLEDARRRVYAACDHVRFDGMQMRRDIASGLRAASAARPAAPR